MSLSDDATTTFTLTRRLTRTVTCTALTVRPSSGVLNAICALSKLHDADGDRVFGATFVGCAITTVEPTLR